MSQPVASPLQTSLSTGERLYALDAVRAFALLLGIFFHGIESLVSFLPPMVWAVKDSQSSVVLDGLFYTSHVFRMQAFFLVSGFFAHMLYHRRGPLAFVKHRAKRIALPLVVFWPLLYACIHILWVWGFKQMGYLNQNPVIANLSFKDLVVSSFLSFDWLKAGFPLGHLWFLYMLVWFCAGVVLVRPLFANKIDKHGYVRAWLDKKLNQILGKWWGSLALGLLTIVPMWGMKNGFGVDTPDHGLMVLGAPFLVYGFYFTLGWLLHRQPGIMQLFKTYWRVNLTVSLIFIGLLVAAFLSVTYQPALLTKLGPTRLLWWGLLYNSVYGLTAMTCVFAFIGFFMAKFNRSSKTIRYFSDSSYWLYLVHLPVVVCFQILVAPYQWPLLLKLGVIFLPSFAILLLSYHLLVRKTWIGILLNGRRHS